MKNSHAVGVGISILVLVTLACSLLTPTPAVQEKSQEVENLEVADTEVLTPERIGLVLLSYNFVKEDVGSCEIPCKHYFNAEHNIFSIVYEDNVAAIAFPITNDKEVARTVGSVLVTLYGSGVTKWSANHLEASLKADQYGYDIDGYDVFLQYMEADNQVPVPMFLITVAPSE